MEACARSMIRTLALGVAALPGGVSVAAERPPLVLVRDGEPAATVVLAREPTRAATFAAAELRRHVRMITGALLPVTDDSAAVSGPTVLVGESEVTRDLGLAAGALGEREYLVRRFPQALVLLGRDAAPAAREADPRSPAWVAGRFGGGLRFDGDDDVVRVMECGFSDEEGTLEAWVWLPGEAQETHGTILRLDGRDPWTYHIVQRVQRASSVAYWSYDGKTCRVVASGELPEGWHHVAATHSLTSGTIELFVDGVSQGTAPYVRTTCRGTPLGVGAVPNGRGNPFRGVIDEVRVSTVVRPQGSNRGGGPYSTDQHTGLLLHCDEGQGSPVDSSGRPVITDPPGWFEGRGTLNAVYDFLERCCDVRWYAPTDIGTVHPVARDLVVGDVDVRRSPAMSYLWMAVTPLYMPTRDDRLSATDVTLWKLRMRLGGKPFAANHSFYGYYGRFLEEHPDWFAQGHKGKPPQLCFTNPAVTAQVAQDGREYFGGKTPKHGARAMGDFFALVPMDNGLWCRCDACQARLDQAQMTNEQFSNGKASNYIWGFVDAVARDLGRSYPDRYISALAYADYAHYPAGVELAPNIAAMMCLTVRHWWAPGMARADRTIFDTWVRKEKGRRPLYVWLYYCFPALNAKQHKDNAFPGFSARTVMQQMRMYADAGIEGIFLEHSSEMGQSYLMDQLELYLTFKLADDPTLDGKAITDEFFRRYYGAAAKPMRAFYELVEDTYTSPDCYPEDARELPGRTQHQNEERAWRWLGTEERMAALGRFMDQATAAARTDAEKQRVDLFRRGIWDYMLEGRRAYLARSAAKEGQAAPVPAAE